ncbi:MAG: NADH-ubiquinone oxidoreductase chain [Rickettsiaceae bacterium]|nr:NADH-ubiquinone oxidoreductase chain [Rickettsiaceae bacterium]
MILIEGYNYWMAILLMMVGFYGIIARGNLIKKIMSLSIFQISVLLLYISGGYVKDGAVPVLKEGVTLYVNPIPQVLMLTAIVVGVAVMAVGLALIVRIKEAYGTIEEDEIIALDVEMNNQENKI